MTTSFESGSLIEKGMRVDRVLVVSTQHMPDLTEDLSPWYWGEQVDLGLTWVWAYEENDALEPIPDWLFQLCVKARRTYGCNWILLDPDGDVIPDLPTYDH